MKENKHGRLAPLLVAGCGRSGTTALMALLASDPRVAVDRAYPLENRYLTYFAKLALLLDRPEFYGRLSSAQLCDFDDTTFGAYPWLESPTKAEAAALLAPSGRHWLRGCWSTLSREARRRYPGARFYAEKVPAWVPALVRRGIPGHTLYLFRDPRDVYVSANAFMRRRNYYSFGREALDTDLDHARNLAHAFLTYFENYRADRHRPDCLLVRYEDLVRQRESVCERLERHTGLVLDADTGQEHLAIHQTAPNLESSLERWRREPVPAEVLRFFDATMPEALPALGYEPAALLVAPALPSARLDQHADGAALEHSSHGVFEPGAEDMMSVRLTGDDFWITLPLPPFEAEAVKEIWVTLSGRTGDCCSLYWRGRWQRFAEERCIHLPFRPGPHWRVVRFPVGRHERWQGTITQLRLDPCNGAIDCGEKRVLLRWVRLVG